MTNKTVKLSATISDRDGTFSHSYEMEMSLPSDIHASAIGLLNKGFGEILRDAHSTYKIKAVGKKGEEGYIPERDATPEEKNAHTRKRLQALIDGTYTFGAGGAKLSPEDKAFRDALNQAGKEEGVKFAAKSDNAAKLTALTKHLAEKQKKDYAEEMEIKVDKKLRSGATYKDALKAYQPSKAADLSDIDL